MNPNKLQKPAGQPQEPRPLIKQILTKPQKHPKALKPQYN